MVRQYITGLICVFGFMLGGYTQFQVADNGQPKLPVHIEGLIMGAENQKFYISSQVLGGQQRPYHIIDIDSTGKFSSDFTIPFKDYFIGSLQNGQALNLILHGNDSIKIYADAKDLLFNCNIIGSQDSDLMMKFYKEFSAFKRVEDSLRMALSKNPSQREVIDQQFAPVAQKFYAYRNTFIQGNASSPALIATISAVNRQNESELYGQIVQQIVNNFSGSGISSLLGKQLVQLEADKKREERLSPGKLAPEIAMPNAAGDTLRLSDLRGKVVLIDFWASWCRPCRMENPNVVKAYNKYHESGFEVYSVSFDKNGMKDRWLAAIEQDGLIWPNHVSELKGFATQAGRDYGVSGIPFTCLIDAEGKIITTNLRGGRLEEELSKIYGF